MDVSAIGRILEEAKTKIELEVLKAECKGVLMRIEQQEKLYQRIAELERKLKARS